MFNFQTVGHDLEFVVRDQETREAVSFVDFQRTTLDSCTIYPDNVLLECNIDPVAPEDFHATIKKNIEDIRCFLNSHQLYADVGCSSALYPRHQLCNKEAHRIGCQPFYNAYMLGVKLNPQPYQDQWRFAGGHIHLGFDKNIVPSHFIVKLLDEYIKDEQSEDIRRDVFYGQRGAYREKPYGLEYRACDNSWVHNPSIIIDAIRKVEQDINEILEG